MIIRSTGSQQVQIGRRGTLFLRPGWYFYVGSALGSGGLRPRLLRHLNGGGRLHWHIDYLLASDNTSLHEICWTESQNRYECRWGEAMEQLVPDIPMPGFGSSDCRCSSHLFFASLLPSREKMSKVLHIACNSGPIHFLQTDDSEREQGT